MTVYLIHFHKGMPRGASPNGTPCFARHYIGYSSQMKRRIEHHRDGSGARILQVANERGITWEVAKVWRGKGKDFERQLKNRKNAAKLCPICKKSKTKP